MIASSQRPLRFPGKGPRPRGNEERFWAKVQKTESCWVWAGAKQNYLHSNGRRYGGYGRFGVHDPGIAGHRMVQAHRFAWELANGPIPRGLDVLHHCDNPPCVKTDGDAEWPDGHLFVGTASDNSRDMSAKGRHGRDSHPEAWTNAIGDNHWTRQKPEKLASISGDNHWSHKHPEKVRRGVNHARSGAKITASMAREIRGATGTNSQIGERFGLHRNTIQRIKTGRLWDLPEAYP